MTQYVVAVPYDKQPFDFGKALTPLKVQVVQQGPVRRTFVYVEPGDLDKLKAALPDYVRIEETIQFAHT